MSRHWTEGIHARLANNGRNALNHNAGIPVGGDLHRLEMAMAEREELLALLKRIGVLLEGADQPGDIGAEYMNDIGHQEMFDLLPLVRAVLAKAEA